MAGPVWIRVADLKPGDRIKILEPAATARVISARPDPGGKVTAIQHGKRDYERDARGVAWLIDFEYLDGMHPGRVAYAWQHPNDRIYKG